MKEIKIEKETVTTSIIDSLNDLKSVRNQVGKTYHFVATISDYHSSKNYTRIYHQVGDLLHSSGIDYMVSTIFLDKLNECEILEVKINIRESGRYSSVSQTFLVVMENNNEFIRFVSFDTAYQAFKFNADTQSKLDEVVKIITEDCI